jgi:small subunit ribosomal protein S20
MPVTTSAKKALRVAERRHTENLIAKYAYKKAVKTVRKDVQAGSEEVTVDFQKAQSVLDRAAQRKTIHPNKAARLKSRLAKLIATTPESGSTGTTSKAKTGTTVGKAAKKSTAKKIATKKSTAGSGKKATGK